MRRIAKRYFMVRRHLWMAVLSAVRHNPAVRPLYARVVAKHPDHRIVKVNLHFLNSVEFRLPTCQRAFF